MRDRLIGFIRKGAIQKGQLESPDHEGAAELIADCSLLAYAFERSPKGRRWVATHNKEVFNADYVRSMTRRDATSTTRIHFCIAGVEPALLDESLASVLGAEDARELPAAIARIRRWMAAPQKTRSGVESIIALSEVFSDAINEERTVQLALREADILANAIGEGAKAFKSRL